MASFKEIKKRGKSFAEIREGKEKSPIGSGFSLKETIRNIPGSAGRLVGDVASLVRHPIQTAKAIGRVGGGAVEKFIPGEHPAEQSFDQVVDFFKQRYGGIENIKRTVQEDPVGFAADISALLTGGGAAIKGVGTLGKLSKVAKVGGAIQKVGLVSEPINLLGKGIFLSTKPFRKIGGALGREILGVTTGAGGDVIREAFRNPTPEFRQALRGKSTADNILTTARDGLNTLKERRATAYRSSLAKIKNVKESIDISSFKNKIDGKLKEFNVGILDDGTLDFSKSVIADRTEAKRIAEFVEEVRKWDDTTPAGLDILKQRLDDFYTPSGRGRALTGSLTSELKKILNKNIKGYAEMTKGYGEASDLIKDIEKTLSLGAGARADITIKKLLSAMKQNNEVRKALVDTIDNLTDTNITSQLAGTALSPGVPGGLIGRSMFAGIIGAGIAINPAAFYGLLFSSPRVVGEFLNALGLSKKAADSAAAFVTSPAGKEALMGIFETSRLNQPQESREGVE